MWGRGEGGSRETSLEGTAGIWAWDIVWLIHLKDQKPDKSGRKESSIAGHLEGARLSHSLSFRLYLIFITEKALAPHSSTPGNSHRRRSLVGCSPWWGHQELDTTERLHFHFSLSRIGEGNGNPFQCSRLENPREGGAWWAAVYGVAQSQTRLKQLSSSSNLYYPEHFN